MYTANLMIALCLAVLSAGCAVRPYDPGLATRAAIAMEVCPYGAESDKVVVNVELEQQQHRYNRHQGRGGRLQYKEIHSGLNLIAVPEVELHRKVKCRPSPEVEAAARQAEVAELEHKLKLQSLKNAARNAERQERRKK